MPEHPLTAAQLVVLGILAVAGSGGAATSNQTRHGAVSGSTAAALERLGLVRHDRSPAALGMTKPGRCYITDAGREALTSHQAEGQARP